MSDEAVSDLKPCPFCGGKPYYDNSDCRSGGKWFGCEDCGAEMRVSYGTSDEEHKAMWNRRTPEE